jgi:hypothetical protein
MPMKKAAIAALVGVSLAHGLQAQDLESVKKQMLLTRYKDAKTEMDKVAVNPKFSTKPETWLVKAQIFNGLATTKGVSKEDSVAYLKESMAALDKYAELEPSKALAADPKYSDVSRTLYVAYFNSGIGKFNDKQWDSAHSDLKKAAVLSDYLIRSKILNGPIDTNAVMYTGASAQNAKKEDEAVVWYSKLADAKVAGKDNEFVYQFLTDYYLRKRDEANFKKYQQVGLQLYPQSKYFGAVADDYARGSNDFNDVIKFQEEKIKANPSDYDLQYNLGAEIYDHIYPRNSDSVKTVEGNVGEWEQKMVGAMEKAAEAKPEKGMPYAVIANSYIKKAEALNNKITALSDSIKNVNKGAKPDKTGKLPPAPKDMLTRRDAMYKDYYNLLDQSVNYFEKASERFSKAATLEPIEKSFYKNAASNLIDIYSMKKTNAKGKPADITKFTAEQKKWEGVYDSIK